MRSLPEHPTHAVAPAVLRAETARLTTTVTALDVSLLGEPSLCPGWSRAHVVSHLAANAVALGRLVSEGTMYPGEEERDAEIEVGSRRPAGELLDAHRTACEELDALLRRTAPDTGRSGRRTPGGPTVRVDAVPFLRLREVVIHHVDLLAGYTFDDVDDDLAALLLAHELRVLRADGSVSVVVHPEGYRPERVGEGATEVTGRASGLLAWLSRGLGDDVTADGALPTLTRGL